jgi:hypothetical protein
MAADKEAWFMFFDERSSPRRVPARVSANVRNEHRQLPA